MRGYWYRSTHPALSAHQILVDHKNQIVNLHDQILDLTSELTLLKRRIGRVMGHVQVYDASLEQTQKLFGAECERARAQTDRVVDAGQKSYISLNKRVCDLENHIGIESPLAKALGPIDDTDEDSVPELSIAARNKGRLIHGT